MLDKIKQLIKSNDITNHHLAFQLSKSLGYSTEEFVKFIFHDKDCWKFCKYDNYETYIFDLNPCWHTFNILKLYVNGRSINIFNNKSSEEEIIQYIVEYIDGIITQG